MPTTSNAAIGAKTEPGPRSEKMLATNCNHRVGSESRLRLDEACIFSRRCEKCGLIAPLTGSRSVHRFAFARMDVQAGRMKRAITASTERWDPRRRCGDL